MVALPAYTVFRDYETDGVPSSGEHRPVKSEIRETLGGLGLVVADRAALKALNTARQTAAYLDEGNRAGFFRWRAGDYSAFVAADTQEGLYVKADAIAATSGAWVRQRDFGSPLSAYWFGAVGNGSADDKTALQIAINLAVLLCAPLFLPVGSYRTTAMLTVTGPLHLYGIGFEGDYGEVYHAAYFDQDSGWKTSVVKPDGNFAAIRISSAGAVNFHDFQIDFDGSDVPTTAAVGIQRTTPSSGPAFYDIGVYDRFTNVCVSRAYYGFDFLDAYDIRVSGCAALNCEGWGMLWRQSVLPSYGDNTVDGCSLLNNQLGGMLIQSGGGLKVTATKINYGNVSTSVGIYIAPNLNVGAQIEPVVIGAGTSIEGQNQGIVIERASGNTLVSQVNISAIQIWTGATCIATVTPGSSWITGLVIAACMLCVGTNGVAPISLAGVNGAIIGANTLAASTGTAAAPAIGANCSNIQQRGNAGTNAALSNVSTPALAASTVNMTNTYPHDVIVSLYAGTMTAVLVGGATVGTGAGQYVVRPAETIAVTYSSAPTMHWRALNP